MRDEVRAANRRLLQAEIRGYWRSKAEFDQDLADEVSPSHSAPGCDADTIQGRGGTSDPTARGADKLRRYMSTAAVRERARRLEIIGGVLEVIRVERPEQYRMVELLFWARIYSPEGVRQKLCISERTYRRWFREVLQSAAEALGWAI